MYAGFPELPLAPRVAEIEDPYSCVKVVPPPEVHRVRLTYAALTHLLALSRQASKHRAVFGRLCGLQLQSEITVSEVDGNPRVEQVSERETIAQQQARRERERNLRRDAYAALDIVRHREMLDTLQVGVLVIGSVTFNPFSRTVLSQLVELRSEGKSAVMMYYDPFRTGVLGRPYLRAYVPTEECLLYHELEKKSKKAGKDHNMLKESGVAVRGILREVPVAIEVDPVQLLGLAAVEIPPTQSTFSAIMSDAANDYITALVHSVAMNTDNIIKALRTEEYTNGREGRQNAALAQRIDTLLALYHLREQTTHLEAVCDSMLLNSSVLRDL